MKKRKPPVILASSLIVLLGAAVIINLPKRQTPEDLAQEQQQQQKQDPSPGAKRDTPDPSSLKKELAVETGDPRGGGMDPENPETPGANPKIATIYIPRAQAVKPQPNDASVQGQWWQDNARANSPEGFKGP
ncbi:MAG TPA: hypothetical protein PLX06_04390 [Fimbriimonadaceae bacterium]|nr:hypothetical protein [Fimbriimonadaceae bacterium]